MGPTESAAGIERAEDAGRHPVFSWTNPAFTVALALVATVVLPRLLVLQVSVIDWDESSYALVAQQMLRGHMPFETVFDHKPIGLYTIFFVFFAVFGDEVWVIRLIPIVFVSLTAILLARLAQLHFGRDALLAGLVAALYGLLTICNGGLATNTEILSNLFVVLAVYLLVRGRLGERISLPYAFAAGGSLGVLFQVNYLTGFLVLGVAAFYLPWVGDVRPVGSMLRRYFANGSVMLAGFAVAGLLLILPIALLGDLGEYLHMQYAYLSDYDRQIGIRSSVDRLYRASVPFLPFLTLPVVLASFASGLFGRASWPFEDSPRDPRLVSWLLLAGFGGIAAVASGRLYPHFFLFMVPALVLLAAGFLWLLRRNLRLRNLVAVWLFLAASLATLQSFNHLWAGLGSLARTIRGAPADHIARVSQAMGRELGPGETIYVYDGQPIHYFQTRTTPPTRFAFPELHLFEEYAVGFGFAPHEEMERILAREPLFIVAGSDPADGRFGRASELLATLLEEKYVALPEFAQVYRRIDAPTSERSP